MTGAISYRNAEGGSFFIQNLNNRFTSLSEFKNTLTKKFWFQVTEESIERAEEMDRTLG